MGYFDEPFSKKLGYLQIVHHAVKTAELDQKFRRANDEALKVSAAFAAFIDLDLDLILGGESFKRLDGTRIPPEEVCISPTGNIVHFSGSMREPDAVHGWIGDTAITTADYADMEARLAAAGMTFRIIEDTLYMDLESRGGIVELPQVLQAGMDFTLKYDVKAAELPDPGASWEQYRDRRHGRRKQRRGKKR